MPLELIAHGLGFRSRWLARNPIALGVGGKTAVQQVLSHELEYQRHGRDHGEEHEPHNQGVDDAVKDRPKAEPNAVQGCKKRRAHEGQDQKCCAKDERPNTRALSVRHRPQADNGENRGKDNTETARRSPFGYMATA